MLGRVYLANPTVEAVIVGGSTGRGLVDRFSDIELGVFWMALPDVDVRRRLVETAGGVDPRVFPEHFSLEDAVYDDFFVGRALNNRPSSGVLVEIVHKTVAGTDWQVDQLIDAHQPDDYLINLAAALAYGQSVGQSSRVDTWKKRLDPYPAGLKTAVLQKEAQIDHFWRSEMLRERGHNLPALYQLWSGIAEKLLKTVAALNGVYFWGTKWAAKMSEALPIQPENFYGRLVAIFKTDPVEAESSLSRLVVETYDCIDAHWPAVSTVRLREIFQYRREPWLEMPG